MMSRKLFAVIAGGLLTAALTADALAVARLEPPHHERMPRLRPGGRGRVPARSYRSVQAPARGVASVTVPARGSASVGAAPLVARLACATVASHDAEA
jgi:hypothetical protein